MIYNALYFYDYNVFLKSSPKDFTNVFRIYLPHMAFSNNYVKTYLSELIKSGRNNPEIIAVLPYVNKGNEKSKFESNFSETYNLADGFMIGNIGDIVFLKTLKDNISEEKILCGDYSLNILNSTSSDLWAEKGLHSITLLPEAESDEITELANSTNNITPEIICCGRVIVMRSEHCFISTSPRFHCGKCGKDGYAGYSLSDHLKNTFPILGCPDDCRNIVLSSKQISISVDKIKKQLCKSCILRYNIFNDDDLKQKGWLQL
ncbi:MAG: U32 family peptidase [Clostridia bacterium]|nr:U32 family peptidase [Clostridia bacterium]